MSPDKGRGRPARSSSRTFWSAQTGEINRRGLVVVGCLLTLAAAGLVNYHLTRNPDEPKVAPQWSVAVGEVMGREVSKLVPEGGRVLVFIMPSSIADRDPIMHDMRAQVLKGLHNRLAGKYLLTIVESSLAIPHFNSSGLTCESLQEAVHAYPDARVVLSFLPPMEPLPELPAPAPKVVVFTLSPEFVRSDLEAGRIQLAAIVRTDDTTKIFQEPKGDVQELFDARYFLVTRETIDGPR